MRRPAARGRANRAGAGGRRGQSTTDRRRAGAAARFQQPDSVTVKSRISPPEFYAAELNAPVPRGNAVGWLVIRGLCPFHQDNRPGSFTIHQRSGAYRCHSCGAAGTDVIDFIRHRDGLTFRAALDRLNRGW